MLKSQFRSLPAIILVALIVCTIQYGCRENTLINSKLSPSNNTDSVYSATLPCITHTYFDDSAVTSTNIGGIPIFQAIGSVVDPYFGTMVGATYFQIYPTDPDTEYYTGYTVDSAVLIMPYSGFTYGSTAIDSTATFQVFYMADTMSINNNYYSFSTKAIDADFPLSAPTTLNISHLDDSILVAGADHSGLRIPINWPLFKSHLWPALAQMESPTSTNPSQDFLNLFNGICVRPADTRKTIGAIPYFELDGVDPYSEASINVYVHPTGTVVDTDVIEAYYFNTGLCGHFNSITKSYSHYPVNNVIHSTQANQPVVALQNSPGPGIDIVIPGIRSLPKGNINKATIQLTLLPAFNDTTAFIYPENISPLGVASATYQPLGTTYAGELYTVYDRYPITSTSPLIILDGLMHNIPTSSGSSVPFTSTFLINIPREVIASIAANNDTLHYHISGTQDYYGAFHMVAGGGNYGVNGTSDTLYRAKLFVVYSKLTK